MASAPVCQMVGLGFVYGPGTPRVPSLTKRGGDKQNDLRILVHIQSGITRKFYKSPQKDIYRKKKSLR